MKKGQLLKCVKCHKKKSTNYFYENNLRTCKPCLKKYNRKRYNELIHVIPKYKKCYVCDKEKDICKFKNALNYLDAHSTI